MKRVVVEFWEHDYFSGVKLIDTKSYKHRRSAIRARNRENRKNIETQVPAYYITVNIKGESSPITR